MAEESGNNVKSPGEEPTSTLQEHPRTTPVAVGKAAASDKTEGSADPLADALKEAEANRDRWVRAVADLENFKKRSLQEKNRLLKYRYEDLLRDLLPVLDNLDRALNHCTASGRTDSLTDGLCLVANMFKDILTRYQVTEIKALGEVFDPNVHEAVARIPAAAGQANRVVEELEKGYMYQDKLLRPAKVVVAMPESS